MSRSLFLASTLLLVSPALAQTQPAPEKTDEVTTTSWGTHPALPGALDFGPPLLRTYAMPEGRFPITEGKITETAGCFARPVSYPSPVQRRWPTIHGTYYRPKGASATNRVPAAVIVHHLGGGMEPEERLGAYLAENGVAAVTISLPNYGKRQEEGTSQGFIRADPFGAFNTFQQAAKDVIRSSDFLRSRPEVDSGRVGVVGVSLGAFVASLAKGIDLRLRQTVLVLGGGDLIGMVAAFPQVKGFLGDADLGPMLRPLVRPIDPTTFARRVNPGEVLMLNTLDDEIVPRVSTDSLWKALGRPEIHWYEGNHHALLNHLDEVLEMSLKHLKSRAPI